MVQSTHDPDQAYLYSTRIFALQGGTGVRVAVPVGAGIKGGSDEKG